MSIFQTVLSLFSWHTVPGDLLHKKVETQSLLEAAERCGGDTSGLREIQ
jgi:hypothetical protein